MAFVNRIGNLLKRNVSKHANLELCASRTSVYQVIRSMSSSKLFVGGLSYATDKTSLREAFSQYGEVIDAKVILDRETGRSRGFGFISYTSTDEAASALNALDGQDLHGRQIKVNYATEKRPGGFGGGYGSGGGGFGGGYGSGGGFNYGGEYGRAAGAGGYASNNYGGGGNYGTNCSYPTGGGNYDGGVGYGSGEGGNYSGGVGQGSFGGGYVGGNSGNYNTSVSGSNDFFNNSEFGGRSGNPGNVGQEQFSEGQGAESITNDFTPDAEGSYRDDNDYANSRGR